MSKITEMVKENFGKIENLYNSILTYKTLGTDELNMNIREMHDLYIENNHLIYNNGFKIRVTLDRYNSKADRMFAVAYVIYSGRITSDLDIVDISHKIVADLASKGASHENCWRAIEKINAVIDGFEATHKDWYYGFRISR